MSETTNVPTEESLVDQSVAHAAKQRRIHKIRKIAMVTGASLVTVAAAALVVIKLNSDGTPSTDDTPPFDL